MSYRLRSTEELVHPDEIFHERLMQLSGNAEMLGALRNINGRIRFVRWIDMDRISRPKASPRSTWDGSRPRDKAPACKAPCS